MTKAIVYIDRFFQKMENRRVAGLAHPDLRGTSALRFGLAFERRDERVQIPDVALWTSRNQHPGLFARGLGCSGTTSVSDFYGGSASDVAPGFELGILRPVV